MSAELSEHDATLLVDASIAASRSGPGVLLRTAEQIIERHEIAAAERALRDAAEALRQAERDGYLWLDASESRLRVPFESVARWLEDRA